MADPSENLDRPVEASATWPEAIYAQLKRVGVRQVGYVPDAGHSRLIELCQRDAEIADVVLTTEEEEMLDQVARVGTPDGPQT